MKKLFVCTGSAAPAGGFACCGAVLCSLAPAHEVAAAQKADSACFRRADGKPVAIETVERDSTGIDTLRRIDTVDSDLIRLRDGGRDGNMILEVAGFGLTLGHTPMQRMELKKAPRLVQCIQQYRIGIHAVGRRRLSSGYASGEKGFPGSAAGIFLPFSVFRRCSSGWRSTGAVRSARGGHAVHARQLPALRQYRHALGNDGGRIVPGRAGRTRRQVESRHSSPRHSRPADFTLRRNTYGSPSPIPTSLLGADAIL